MKEGNVVIPRNEKNRNGECLKKLASKEKLTFSRPLSEISRNHNEVD